MSKEIKHISGAAGGYLVGNSHKNGGIQAINKAIGKPLEMEGGEVVITKPAVEDNELREFEGEMLTNRQILSKINESGGGVSFAELGAELPTKIEFCGTKYKYGGETLTDYEIAHRISKCGCNHEEESYADGGKTEKRTTAIKTTSLKHYKELLAKGVKAELVTKQDLNKLENGGEIISNVIKVGDLFVMDLPDIFRNVDYGKKRQVAIVTNTDNPEKNIIYNGSLYYYLPNKSLISQQKSNLSEILKEFRKNTDMSISKNLHNVINELPKKIISQKTIDLIKERYTNRNIYTLSADLSKDDLGDCYGLSIEPKHLSDKRTLICKIDNYYSIQQINFKEDYYYIFDSIEDAIDLKYGQPIYANGGNLEKELKDNAINVAINATDTLPLMEKGGLLNDSEKKELYQEWSELVNMSSSELQNYYDSKEGETSGLSASEAKEQGIKSGRESARWIIKMKETPMNNWTSEMWEWAKRQISFIKRMSGVEGDLYDENNKKTRKHKALLIWGHNPEKYAKGGELETSIVKLEKNLIKLNERLELALEKETQSFGERMKSGSNVFRMKFSTSKSDELKEKIKETQDQLIELKKSKIYDLGSSFAGGAVVVYDRNQSDNVDYKTIAHVFSTGEIKYFENNLPKEVIEYVENVKHPNNKSSEKDNEFNYMMLSRLKSDNDYFLGYGNRNENNLWATNVEDQIIEMKRLWNILTVKPEWLSMEDILNYEKQMTDSNKNTNKNISTLISDYKNPYEVNRAIEALLDSKENDFTPNEIEFISNYSGYGGLEKQGSFSDEELKGLLYEYFTPDAVVKKMWALAYKYGFGTFSNPHIMEPSVGTGNFFKYAPTDAELFGNEINNYSKRVCEILYPKAMITLQPFEKNFISKNNSIKNKLNDIHKYHLVIGNPPYGRAVSKYLAMGESDYTKATSFTEYFITRGLDLLHPGGLLIFVVGAEQYNGGTLFLDSGISVVKKNIFDKAQLIDAYRLPTKIFERTGVASEILVFKKK